MKAPDLFSTSCLFLAGQLFPGAGLLKNGNCRDSKNQLNTGDIQ
jgi:hypothetical protein